MCLSHKPSMTTLNAKQSQAFLSIDFGFQSHLVLGGNAGSFSQSDTLNIRASAPSVDFRREVCILEVNYFA